MGSEHHKVFEYLGHTPTTGYCLLKDEYGGYGVERHYIASDPGYHIVCWVYVDSIAKGEHKALSFPTRAAAVSYYKKHVSKTYRKKKAVTRWKLGRCTYRILKARTIFG